MQQIGISDLINLIVLLRFHILNKPTEGTFWERVGWLKAFAVNFGP